MSLEFMCRLANGLVPAFTLYLPLQYKLPQDQIYQQHNGKVLLLGTAGGSWWVGMKLAEKAEQYFNERIANSKKNPIAGAHFSKKDKVIISLCIYVGIGAFFYALNLPRVNQIFERYTPYYTSILIRGIGYGYMSMHTVHAFDALFYRDVT